MSPYVPCTRRWNLTRLPVRPPGLGFFLPQNKTPRIYSVLSGLAFVPLNSSLNVRVERTLATSFRKEALSQTNGSETRRRRVPRADSGTAPVVACGTRLYTAQSRPPPPRTPQHKGLLKIRGCVTSSGKSHISRQCRVYSAPSGKQHVYGRPEYRGYLPPLHTWGRHGPGDRKYSATAESWKSQCIYSKEAYRTVTDVTASWVIP